MGNACFRMCSCCFGRYRSRKYLRTRYNVERDISIEFENLMDEENVPQEELNSTITDTERLLLLNKKYGTLIEQQKRTDQDIDQELVRQEEELRMEEEAYYEAKREALRAAAAAAKQQQQKQLAATADRRKPWVGDDDEWELADGDEDFEMFLDAVKKRSLAARTRSLPSQVPIDEQSSSSLTSKDKNDDASSSLDLEWEHEAGLQPLPKKSHRSQLISEEESKALAELAIRPNMLSLKDSVEFEWNSDIDDNDNSDGTTNSESKTLLAQSTDAPIR